MENRRLEEIIEELRMEHEYIGIRIQYEPFCIGPIDHESTAWEDGYETDRKLGGICAVHVDERNAVARYMEAVDHYFGTHAAILVSDCIEYGDDDNEIIMKDAEVAYIIK